MFGAVGKISAFQPQGLGFDRLLCRDLSICVFLFFQSSLSFSFSMGAKCSYPPSTTETDDKRMLHKPMGTSRVSRSFQLWVATKLLFVMFWQVFLCTLKLLGRVNWETLPSWTAGISLLEIQDVLIFTTTCTERTLEPFRLSSTEERLQTK